MSKWPTSLLKYMTTDVAKISSNYPLSIRNTPTWACHICIPKQNIIEAWGKHLLLIAVRAMQDWRAICIQIRMGQRPERRDGCPTALAGGPRVLFQRQSTVHDLMNPIYAYKLDLTGWGHKWSLFDSLAITDMKFGEYFRLWNIIWLMGMFASVEKKRKPSAVIVLYKCSEIWTFWISKSRCCINHSLSFQSWKLSKLKSKVKFVVWLSHSLREVITIAYELLRSF